MLKRRGRTGDVDVTGTGEGRQATESRDNVELLAARMMRGWKVGAGRSALVGMPTR